MLHAHHIPNSNKSSATFNVTAENGTEPSKEIGGHPQQSGMITHVLTQTLVKGWVPSPKNMLGEVYPVPEQFARPFSDG